ncbi:MAG TPA: hypothetical protein V6D17_01555, partial [Candidatus Obscuribacterales bacterium]
TKNRYDHSSVQLKLDLQRNYTLDYLFSARFPCGYLPISGRLMLRFTYRGIPCYARSYWAI